MRILLLIIVSLVILMFVALSILFLPLPYPIPVSGSSARNLIAAVAVGVLGLLTLMVLGIYLINTVNTRRHSLDAVFIQAGLTPETTPGIDRRYIGEIQGYQFIITHTIALSNHPSVLDIQLAITSGIRAAISTNRILLDCQTCPPVTLNASPLNSLNVRADDVYLFTQCMDDPTFAKGLHIIFQTSSQLGTRELSIQPDRIWLRIHSMHLDGSEVATILKGLIYIAGSLNLKS